MSKIHDQFIINPQLLSGWKTQGCSSLGLFKFWRLKYLILLMGIISVLWLLILPTVVYTVLILWVWLWDFLAYRKNRRFRLVRETRLLEKFLNDEMEYAFYAENQAKDYERDDIDQFSKRRVSQVNPIHFIRKRVIEDLSRKRIFSGDHLLDVGCHYGLMTEPFKQAWPKITGMDLQRYHLSEFKRRMGSAPVIANALHLPFKSGKVDGVSFMEIIEHLPDPFSVLIEIKQILPPGGKLLLTTNNRHEIHWEYLANPLIVLEKIAGVFCDRVLPVRPILWLGFQDELYYYHTAYSKKEIRAILTSCGFNIKLLKSFSYANNFYELLNKIGIDLSEAKYATFQLAITAVLNKIPLLDCLGAHWLIVAEAETDA